MSFSPDFTWYKCRAGGANRWHYLFDTSRGDGKALYSNLTYYENQESVINAQTFETNGTRIVRSSGDHLNNNDDTYVAWNWKAGGLTPSKTYKVKVVSDSTDFGHGTGSNKYQFFKSDGSTGFGTNGVDLDLQEGGTYTFDWSHSSAQSHPIRFSLTNDGTHSSGTSGGSEYTTGVVKNDSAYTTTITVASGVANLYYYCQSHSGMGAEVRTNATSGQTNFDGSILSVSNSNTTAGFSIVVYTGVASSNQTVAHGLQVGEVATVPEMVILKKRGSASNWNVIHPDRASNDHYMQLNSDSASINTNTPFAAAALTSTVFTVGANDGDVNTDGQSHIAFCFASVEGYSKFGSYSGNAASTTPFDGTFVYLGFRPAWLMLKRKDTSGQWRIYDYKRSPNTPTINYLDELLSADSDAAEAEGSTSRLDFLSNGFKLRGSASGTNKSGGTYIYMAFAEAPFKYANAR